MASRLVKDSVRQALEYSNRYQYPLTLDELYLWQPFTRLTRRQIAANLKYSSIDGYYFLPGHQNIVGIRQSRMKTSREKWPIAQKVGNWLKYIPSIKAVFVTGSLAMDNSPKNDDIDLFVVTSAHTLWLTRILVVCLLKTLGLRRPPRLPEHSSPRVVNKICDNLYLDEEHLSISHVPANSSKSLYLAHEILQSRCLWDRGDIHRRFLDANRWVSDYLPQSYEWGINSLPQLPGRNINQTGWIKLLLFPFNFLFFVIQYTYMRSGFSQERTGLGYAFFHPTAQVV